MEFVAITTQEQFDAAIGERLKREREAVAKKYSDYDTLKTSVANYEKQLGELTKSMEDNAKKYSGYDKQLAEMQTKIKGYETHSVKTRIAHEVGIPYELAGRLAGESEEDIRKDAENLAKLVGKSTTATTTPPLKSTEPSGGDPKQAALRSLTAELTAKGD